MHQAALGVVPNQRRRGRAIDIQSVARRRVIVVAPAATHQPVERDIRRKVEHKHGVHTRGVPPQHFIQRLGLRKGAWKPIEAHALAPLPSDETLNELHHQVVRHESPRLNVFAHLNPGGRASLDGLAKQPARRHVCDVEPVDQQLRLSTLARPRRPEEHDNQWGVIRQPSG